jgi:hypothetical protein
MRRISIGKATGSPRAIVKNAVSQSLVGSGAAFYQIGSTLEYCGYSARFGFRIDPAESYGMTLDEIRLQLGPSDEVFDSAEEDDLLQGGAGDLERADVELALAFLRRHDPLEPIWIDSSEKVLEFSRAREFASVLKLESRLRAWNVLRGIRVYLQPVDGSDAIEIRHASSGQLTLISSLLFVIVNTSDEPIVIIDEPENSLHPKWQREYIEKIMTALSYRNATIVVATHAPLIVTGALVSSPKRVSVFEVRNSRPQRLQIDHATSSLGSIEEILWRAFEVVTPANHFVSEQIVSEVSRFEKGEVRKDEVLALIRKMEDESFDERQRGFFNAVRALLDKVEAGHDEGDQ